MRIYYIILYAEILSCKDFLFAKLLLKWTYFINVISGQIPFGTHNFERREALILITGNLLNWLVVVTAVCTAVGTAFGMGAFLAKKQDKATCNAQLANCAAATQAASKEFNQEIVELRLAVTQLSAVIVNLERQQAETSKQLASLQDAIIRSFINEHTAE